MGTREGDARLVERLQREIRTTDTTDGLGYQRPCPRLKLLLKHMSGRKTAHVAMTFRREIRNGVWKMAIGSGAVSAARPIRPWKHTAASTASLNHLNDIAMEIEWP